MRLRILDKLRSLPIVVLVPNPAFRNWWVSSGLGQASVTLAPMALSWAVFEATDSSPWVGVVNGVPILAIVPLTLGGGVLLDRVGRLRLFRQIHFSLAVVFAIVSIVISVLPSVHPLALLPVAAGIAAASSILVLASRLLIAELVNRDLLANSLSLSYLLRTTLVMVGPPTMGVIILVGSVGHFFGVLGLMHFVAWLAALRISGLRDTASTDTRPILSDIVEGLRYCRRTQAVAWLLIAGLMATFANVYLPFLPFYARDLLGIGPGGFGLLIAAESVGGVVGALVLGTVWKVRRKGLTLLLVSISYGFAMLVFALSQNVTVSVVALFVMGVSSAVWISMINACLQLATESGMRGRVVAVYSTIARTVRPLGFLLGGSLALLVEPPVALVTAALVGLLFHILVLVAVRSVRSIE